MPAAEEKDHIKKKIIKGGRKTMTGVNVFRPLSLDKSSNDKFLQIRYHGFRSSLDPINEKEIRDVKDF